MHRKRISTALVLLCLVISLTITTSITSAQDLQSDRSSIRAIFVLGNNPASQRNENFSYATTLLSSANPDLGLNLNLTVSGSVGSESALTGVDLVIICMPNATTIPNATIFKNFAENGHSLFLLSDYNGGGSSDSSSVLNGILNETNIHGVSFAEDAISISNTTSNWQNKVYDNNTFAVITGSSEFHANVSSQSAFNGVVNAVTLSCSLNFTIHNDLSFVGSGSAMSNSSQSDWLLLTDNGVYRSILCGSASMFNNTYLPVENNRVLFRQLILWLVERFQTSPPDMFPYLVVASSAISVLGIAVYLISKRARTLV